MTTMTRTTTSRTETPAAATALPNGAAMAAFLAAGIGTFALGLFVVLDQIDLLPAPSLYDPAGGLSGRTTMAVAVWLLAWGILHWRWRSRAVDAARVALATVGLIVLGVLGTFPPLWELF